jgi:hypothetical protein
MELLFALAPLLRAHGGNRVAIRRACPERWLHALDVALELPEWFVERSEPTPDLLKRWLQHGSAGWQLPTEAPLRIRTDEGQIRLAAA